MNKIILKMKIFIFSDFFFAFMKKNLKSKFFIFKIIFSSIFFELKKKSLDRCEILQRIHFSHSRGDLTSISQLNELG